MQGGLTLQRLDENTSLRDDLPYEYNELSNKLKNVDGSVDENYSVRFQNKINPQLDDQFHLIII
jgi:hypothetical protein